MLKYRHPSLVYVCRWSVQSVCILHTHICTSTHELTHTWNKYPFFVCAIFFNGCVCMYVSQSFIFFQILFSIRHSKHLEDTQNKYQHKHLIIKLFSFLFVCFYLNILIFFFFFLLSFGFVQFNFFNLNFFF